MAETPQSYMLDSDFPLVSTVLSTQLIKDTLDEVNDKTLSQIEILPKTLWHFSLNWTLAKDNPYSKTYSYVLV